MILNPPPFLDMKIAVCKISWDILFQKTKAFVDLWRGDEDLFLSLLLSKSIAFTSLFWSWYGIWIPDASKNFSTRKTGYLLLAFFPLSKYDVYLWKCSLPHRQSHSQGAVGSLVSQAVALTLWKATSKLIFFFFFFFYWLWHLLLLWFVMGFWYGIFDCFFCFMQLTFYLPKVNHLLVKSFTIEKRNKDGQRHSNN